MLLYLIAIEISEPGMQIRCHVHGFPSKLPISVQYDTDYSGGSVLTKHCLWVLAMSTCFLYMPGSLPSGFIWSRWRGKRSRHSRHMRNAQFYVSGKRSIKFAQPYVVVCFVVISSTQRLTHCCHMRTLIWAILHSCNGLLRAANHFINYM